MTTGDDRWRWGRRGVVVAAAVLAVVGARPYAGSWNDASRLAAAESLAEHGTFAIDASIFVKVSQAGDRPSPYRADAAGLRAFGTLDKLFINGHFYSDKSPVPNALLAGVYWVWLSLGGPTATERPDLFCWMLTVVSSGLAFVVAVWCVDRLGGKLGLTGSTRFLFVLAFAFGTVGPAYTRHVNSHALFLGAAAAMCLGLAYTADRATWWQRWGWPAVVGAAAGFGYTCDLGIGPVLLVCLAPYCVWAYRDWRPVAVAALAGLPWVAAYHVMNYATGGTLVPANMVREYLSWPGSPFTADIMTGGLKHSVSWFFVYCADLVVGKKGFLLSNIPLWVTPGTSVMLWRWRREARPVVLFAVAWAGLSLALYGATSTNYSGQSCSIRWFVPLLAPGFWLAGLLLREFPRYRPDFAWLTGCGCVLGMLMWLDGPWVAGLVPGFWVWVALAGIGWGVVRWRESSSARRHEAAAPDTRPALTTRSSSAA